MHRFLPFSHRPVLHASPSQSRRQGKKKGGSTYEGRQPPCRKDYSAKMGGADRADPFNGPYGFLHKAYVYFWRWVLEQKLQQALTNA